MRATALAVLAGVIFATGLVISGMTEPARVTAFLDVGGAWDPTLAFVMGGAILIHAPLAHLIRQRAHPLFDTRFHIPTRRDLDPALVGGAALFGVGWGLSGYCPGPALVSIATGVPALVFVGALVVGTALGRRVRPRANS